MPAPLFNHGDGENKSGADGKGTARPAARAPSWLNYSLWALPQATAAEQLGASVPAASGDAAADEAAALTSLCWPLVRRARSGLDLLTSHSSDWHLEAL
jgi:hypothetical protein